MNLFVVVQEKMYGINLRINKTKLKIEATFRSNDVDEIYGMVNEIKSRLEKVDGITDLRIDDVIGDDEVFIDQNCYGHLR